MPSYGSHPSEFLEYLEENEATEASAQLLVNLAKAYKNLLQIEEAQEGGTFLNDKQLVLNAIERAWREALYIRASLPPNLLSCENCPISISRMGNILEDETKSKRSNSVSGRSDESDSRRKTNKGIPKKKRGARVYTKRIRRGSS